MGVLGILEWQKKNRKATKKKKKKFVIGMLTCHVDCQGYVEKHFFGCVARKLKQKLKFLPATLRI